MRRRLELGLTFRKAFFSKVFMINGGMAARKRQIHFNLSLIFIFSSRLFNYFTKVKYFTKKVYVTFRLFSYW